MLSVFWFYSSILCTYFWDFESTVYLFLHFLFWFIAVVWSILHYPSGILNYSLWSPWSTSVDPNLWIRTTQGAPRENWGITINWGILEMKQSKKENHPHFIFKGVTNEKRTGTTALSVTPVNTPLKICNLSEVLSWFNEVIHYIIMLYCIYIIIISICNISGRVL